MKCPNCSFMNSEDSKTCKVCGFELNVRPYVTKKRTIDAEEEAELDSVLKSLFGTDEDDPLDVATTYRLLKNKRDIKQEVEERPPVSNSAKNVFADPIDSETTTPPVDMMPPVTPIANNEETDSDSNHRPAYNLRIIIATFGVLIILIALFKVGLLDAPWRYEKDEVETTEATEALIEPTSVSSAIEAITIGDLPAMVPINNFLNELPDFINKGNLVILADFKRSQDALEVLTPFANIGNLEKIAAYEVVSSDVTDQNGVFTVSTQLNRLINGQQTEVNAIWDFTVVNQSGTWKIDAIGVQTDGLIIASKPMETTENISATQPPSTEPPTENTTQPTTPSTTEAVTQTTTEAVTLSGFISSGGFSGGEGTFGQDVAFARYGYHQSYERIVFDIYEWLGGEPTTRAERITLYATNISADGKTISITLNGAIDAYARSSGIDLKGSPFIKSIDYMDPGNGDAVAIIISLSQKSQYKVFELKSPAKLVVDIAPLN